MDNILTRQATAADVAIVYDFVCGLENEQFEKKAFEQCYKACFDKAHHHYILAIVDDKPVGYISCHGQILLHHCGMVYEIQEMYVLPKHRSRGVGKLLLEALLQHISQGEYVLLEVASNMMRKDAHRFYEANGFIKATYKFKKLP